MILDTEKWKSRFVLYLKETIIILGMWSIWLIHEYVINNAIMVILTIFIVLIIVIEVITREAEYSRSVNTKKLEDELNRLKNKN